MCICVCLENKRGLYFTLYIYVLIYVIMPIIKYFIITTDTIKPVYTVLPHPLFTTLMGQSAPSKWLWKNHRFKDSKNTKTGNKLDDSPSPLQV